MHSVFGIQGPRYYWRGIRLFPHGQRVLLYSWVQCNKCFGWCLRGKSIKKRSRRLRRGIWLYSQLFHCCLNKLEICLGWMEKELFSLPLRESLTEMGKTPGESEDTQMSPLQSSVSESDSFLGHICEREDASVLPPAAPSWLQTSVPSFIVSLKSASPEKLILFPSADNHSISA